MNPAKLRGGHLESCNKLCNVFCSILTKSQNTSKSTQLGANSTRVEFSSYQLKQLDFFHLAVYLQHAKSNKLQWNVNKEARFFAFLTTSGVIDNFHLLNLLLICVFVSYRRLANTVECAICVLNVAAITFYKLFSSPFLLIALLCFSCADNGWQQREINKSTLTSGKNKCQLCTNCNQNVR